MCTHSSMQSICANQTPYFHCVLLIQRVSRLVTVSAHEFFGPQELVDPADADEEADGGVDARGEEVHGEAEQVEQGDADKHLENDDCVQRDLREDL